MYDYYIVYKYFGEKYKEIYFNRYLYDKYLNGKKGEYYFNEKYLKDNYMDIYVVGYLFYSLWVGGFFLEYIYDYLVGIDGYFLGVWLFRERGRYEYFYLIFIGKVVLIGVKYFGF